MFKNRQPGQGGNADSPVRDLRAQLLEAEAAHFSKTHGSSENSVEQSLDHGSSVKGQLEVGIATGRDNNDEDPSSKRRRILEETRDIDADSEGPSSGTSDEDRFGC